MKRKYIIILMQFLTSICIISVGFSSWIIVTPPIVAEGQIVSSSVMSTDEYLTISIDNLKYCSEGFVNEEKISYTGYIVLNCTLDISKLKQDFHDQYSSIKMELSLSREGYNLFETTTKQSSTHVINSNGINITEKFPSGKKKNKYMLDITLNDVLNVDHINGLYYFSITYQFNSHADLYSRIYTSLTENPEFNVEVKMEGIKGVNYE